LEIIDLTEPGFLFTNGAGNPVRAQEFYNGGAPLAQPTTVPAVLRHT
jgi:hypothetical protein